MKFSKSSGGSYLQILNLMATARAVIVLIYISQIASREVDFSFSCKFPQSLPKNNPFLSGVVLLK